MIGKFFHTPPSKQFNYKPRFYDPDKEEHESRVKRVKDELFGQIYVDNSEIRMDGNRSLPPIHGNLRTKDYSFLFLF